MLHPESWRRYHSFRTFALPTEFPHRTEIGALRRALNHRMLFTAGTGSIESINRISLFQSFFVAHIGNRNDLLSSLSSLGLETTTLEVTVGTLAPTLTRRRHYSTAFRLRNDYSVLINVLARQRTKLTISTTLSCLLIWFVLLLLVSFSSDHAL